MKSLLLFFVLLLLGCKSHAVIENKEMKEREKLSETTLELSKHDLQQSDSVYITDSVRIVERHDTVLIERKTVKNVSKKVVEVVKDTVVIVKTDTVQVKNVEVRHEKPPDKRRVSWRVIAFSALCVIIVFIGYKDVKRRWG